MSDNDSFVLLNEPKAGEVPVKAWVKGVPVEDSAKNQLINLSKLPFVYKWIVGMPDVHMGRGCAIGTVLATKGAIIPSAAGSDLGCGMQAIRTSLTADDLPDSLEKLRSDLEANIPMGRTNNGGANDIGSWQEPPIDVQEAWAELEPRYRQLIEKHPKISHHRPLNQLCSLGSSNSNHFIEVCLDQDHCVWVMLHSGSRGPGAGIGGYFMDLAKKEMERYFISLPDWNLSYLPEHTEYYDDYLASIQWAQEYASANRNLMMNRTLKHLRAHARKFDLLDAAIDCKHNFIAIEHHFGQNVVITRKGATRARKGDLAVIPGSMGAKSFIVRGLGNPDSFTSCSHGAGRRMSRTEARNTFTLKDHRLATEGVCCRKDRDVIDETPEAYKNIDQVMAAQQDLVSVVATLKQVLCVKG